MESKVAIVTGGASDHGKAYAEILLQHGVKVCISDNNKDLGESTLKELKAKYGSAWVIFYHCDVMKKDQLESLMKHTISTFGQLDIVVNNAGAPHRTDPDWKSAVDLNLTAVVQGTLVAIEYMGEHNGGSGGVIINTSSLTAVIPVHSAPQAFHTATKYGVVGFTRAMAMVSREFYGIRVNAMCPTHKDTEFVNFMSENITDDEVHNLNIDDRLDDSVVEQGLELVLKDDVAKQFMVLVNDASINGQMMVLSNQGCALR